jgi:predicted dehydrogenase
MTETFRVGLVGCGRLAERGYLPAFARARGVRLVAVADPASERCERVAGKVPRYESAQALIADQTVHGLVLATPAAAHLEDARLATAAGLAVLVEKPPAVDRAEAAALAALQPTPSVGFNRRFDPTLQRLREAVPSSGGLELTLELHHARDSWDSYQVRDDALLAHGTHLLDLARWLTRSEIERVRAEGLAPTAAVVELELERGLARIACSTGQARREAIEIRDETGTLVARQEHIGLARRVLLRLRGGTSLVRLLVDELEAFAVKGRGQRHPLLATAADGHAVMAAIDSVRRSAQLGGTWCALDAIGSRPA